MNAMAAGEAMAAAEAAPVSLDGARERFNAGDVSEIGWLTWDIRGDPARGDSLAFYVVNFNTDRCAYQCACQRVSARAGFDERGVCEHIVAVVLYRGEHGDSRVGSGGSNPDYVPNHT